MTAITSLALFPRSLPACCPRRHLVPHRSFVKHRFQSFSLDELPLFGAEALEAEESVNSQELYENFDEMLDKAGCLFSPGQRVEGLIIDVDDSGVYVDLGTKELGFCSASDLTFLKVPKPADLMKLDSRRMFEVVQVGVKKKFQATEITMLSRVSIMKELLFRRLRVMNELQVRHTVKVELKNRGGYVVVDPYGLQGFMPGGQAAINPSLSGRSDDPLLENIITVKILDVVEDEDRFIVSQRRVAESQTDATQFAVGTVLDGIVEGVMSYGVFVSINGVAGLLHESQVSWTSIDDMESMFKVNDRIKVMVLSYDRLRGRLALSTKKLEPNAGDMIHNRELVYEKAEEMAAKFRQEVELAEARSRDVEILSIGPEISIRPSATSSPETNLVE